MRLFNRRYNYSIVSRIPLRDWNGRPVAEFNISKDLSSSDEARLIFMYTLDEINRYHMLSIKNVNIRIDDLRNLVEEFEKTQNPKGGDNVS